MPHFPKPFFRPNRNTWYVQVGKKQINLGPDKKKAFRRYHDLMREERPAHAPCVKIVELIDEFLEFVRQNQSAGTFEWYRFQLQRFAERYPDLEVGDLKPFHVQRWIDSLKNVNSGTRRNHARSIIRVMWWAMDQGHIEKNPLARFKKPKGGTRDTVISPEEFDRILDHVPNDAFRDLITFAWETGARASECLAVEKRHVDLRNERIVFPQSEEKMERAPRVIYLSPVALEIVRRRLVATTGKLFLNTDRRPWTTEAVNCAFNAVRVRMGKEAMVEKGSLAGFVKRDLLLNDLQSMVKRLGFWFASRHASRANAGQGFECLSTAFCQKVNSRHARSRAIGPHRHDRGAGQPLLLVGRETLQTPAARYAAKETGVNQVGVEEPVLANARENFQVTRLKDQACLGRNGLHGQITISLLSVFSGTMSSGASSAMFLKAGCGTLARNSMSFRSNSMRF